MNLAPVLSSRKSLRKAARKAKKQRKRQHYIADRPREMVKPGTSDVHVAIQRKRRRVRRMDDHDNSARKDNLELRKSESETLEEDMEIEYLEKKLGIGQGANEENCRKNRKRLEKELIQDGFEEDMLDFLDGLTSSKSPAPTQDLSPSSSEEDEPHFGGISTEFEEHSQAQTLIPGPETSAEDEEIAYLEKKLGIGSGTIENARRANLKRMEKEFVKDGFSQGIMEFVTDESFKEDDEAERVDNLIEEEQEDAVYLPKTDIYGKQAKDGENRPLFFSTVVSNTSEKVRRRINGLLNRVAESNVSPICNQIVAMYKEHSRRDVNEALSKALCDVLRNEIQVMATLATVFSCLVAALCVNVDQEVGSFVLERIVIEFDRVFKQDEKQFGRTKVCSNLLVLISHLFTFGVISDGLLYDIGFNLISSLSQGNVSIFLVLINQVGPRMRTENPAKLKSLIERLQDRARMNDDDDGERPKHIEFMLEEIYALKNNRKKPEAPMMVVRLRKWVRHIQEQTGNALSGFEISLDDLLHAEERGRWWIVGGVWHGQREKIDLAKQSLNGTDMETSGTRGKGGVGNMLFQADPKLMKLARKHHMNTDIRKAVFIAIMTSADYVEAFKKLLSLNLRDRQEREIVHVLMRCCGVSRRYNPYFHHLARRVCEYHPRFKFTFQLAFWDIFNELEDEEMKRKPRRIANLARLLAHLVLKMSLSLAVLKVVDFPKLGEGGTRFFNVFFHTLLQHGGDSNTGGRMVMKALNRLGASEEFTSVSDGIILFLHHKLSLEQDEYTPDVPVDPRLLKKRIKAAKRLFDAIATASEQDMFENAETTEVGDLI